MQRLIAVVLAASLLPYPATLVAQDEPAIIGYKARHHPVPDTAGMVASQHAVASEIGAEVLAAGGNAVDAAVAVGFALAVAGLHAAHERFGRLPWRELLEPAIELAAKGIVVSHDLAGLLEQRRERLTANAASRAYFYREDATAYAPGERLVQKDLARSLRLIARRGPEAFYKGDIAKKIAKEMEANGGLIDMAALAAYEPVFREPVRGSYRGRRIVSMPPSSSGGIHIIQMLNVLEHYDVASLGPGSADSAHLLAEVMKLAYADRSKHLGDTAYYDVPVDWLTSEAYARELAAGIDMAAARPASEIAPGTAPAPESPDTTHFSIMDGEGNAVANACTLNFSYGSGISVPGTGFLLNNEMNDFVSKPGVPNAFGLLGGEANAVEAGKRPLSSMTPTMVFKDGRPWLLTGSPGGSQIITSVLQMVVNVVDHSMNIADATSVPRLHHQWQPDVLLLESGFSPDTVRELERRGHDIEASDGMGSLQSVMREDGLYYGASDPRRPQAGSVGPAMHTATER